MLHCFKSVALKLAPVSLISQTWQHALDHYVCKALLGMHAFTGCDTVRAFAGKGKIRALTILKANAEFKEAFAQLVVQWNLPPNLHVKLEEFVSKLYATRRATTSIDALFFVLCKER